jgi:hypothetical protein
MTPPPSWTRPSPPVDQTIESVRYDRLDPAELSAVIAGLRQLFWHTTVTAIVAGLHAVAAQLADIDTVLTETHDHAAHLFRR